MRIVNGIFEKLKWLVILWLAGRLPDCKEMTKSLGESLDRRMGLATDNHEAPSLHV